MPKPIPVEKLHKPSTVMKTAIVVWVKYEEEEAHILCNRYELVRTWISDEFPDVTCLNLVGAMLPDGQAPQPGRIATKSWVVPIKFVTYIGLGPSIQLVQSSKKTDRLVIHPDGRTAPESMSHDQILARLSEFGDPA